MTTTEKVEFMLDAVRMLNTALKAVVGESADARIYVYTPVEEDERAANLALALCLRYVGGTEKEFGGTRWVVQSGVTVFTSEPLPLEHYPYDIPF